MISEFLNILVRLEWLTKISETATYAFDSVDSCEPSRSVMKVPGPEFVYNAGGVSLIYQVRKFFQMILKKINGQQKISIFFFRQKNGKSLP